MNKRLFVAGLPFSTTGDELKNLFLSIGNVVSATVITDKMTGKSKGFGFVEMETEDEANNAISKLNDTDYGGRKLIIAEAKPKEERERPRHQGGFHRGPSRGGFSGQRSTFGRRREGGRGNFGRSSGSFRGRGDRG